MTAVIASCRRQDHQRWDTGRDWSGSARRDSDPDSRNDDTGLAEFGDPRAYADPMAYERITIDPGRMRGLPCIRDTRLTVTAVLGQLAAGRTSEQVLADYPYLEQADILAALEFAADAVQEHELPLARPA
jgi:uncharacterized protein (DUF433 family)